ncbi:SURF1 family protein [Anaplasma phagocytophilum str. Norway variant1]|uniref:SURF1-like protein n=1 Tax=Anaplasma phagocytophilum str. Norway variant1 TaxID=1392506 RepID=A0A7H9DZV6_ANAPH|nr:SURF1 family protein [Anaplasma phagocytophilum]QLL67085.1 SURF1 family protein [Anaplasma phagocytophilum str. Norway variant1]
MRFGSIIFKIFGCVFPCAILLTLGTWQILRLQEKLHIIHTMSGAIVPLPEGDDLQSHNYKRIQVQGTFKTTYFRVFAGRAGYYFLQPMELTDGRHVLINRGTLSEYAKIDVQDASVHEQVSGTLYCTLSSKTKWVAANNADKNLWFWYDIESMSKHIGVPLEGCIIWGDNTSLLDGLQPNKMLQVRNDHLEYAITWYTLAMIWVGGYIYFLRTRQRFCSRPHNPE